MTPLPPRRPDLRYYAIVRQYLDDLTPAYALNSLLDVGAGHNSTATWGNFRRRWALDLYHVPNLPGVTGLRGDFLALDLAAARIPTPVSAVTCLQVLEHLPDDVVYDFAARLRAIAAYVIVSVPLYWPAGTSDDHRQDPVTLPTVAKWMDGPSFRQHVTIDNYNRAGLRLVGLWKGTGTG